MAQRILVVDDDREIVRLVCAYLERNGYEVLTAHDGETALHKLRRERPDLLLLDLMLPGRDGSDQTRVVRGDTSLAALPIIMLTAPAENHDRTVGLELGADDSVSKPFHPGEVVARVRAVLRQAQGEVGLRSILKVGDVVLDLDRRRVEVAGQLVQLTPTEFSLLRALAERPGRALTRLEMIECGWGYNYEGVERTVDSHIKNLRRKLEGTSGLMHRIETVFGVGYRLAVLESEGNHSAPTEAWEESAG
jgi:two-component system alkaline phosphatase synthesis response regulator PhoP